MTAHYSNYFMNQLNTHSVELNPSLISTFNLLEEEKKKEEEAEKKRMQQEREQNEQSELRLKKLQLPDEDDGNYSSRKMWKK